MEQIKKMTNRFIEKSRNVLDYFKEIDMNEIWTKVKETPRAIYYKNTPTLIILVIGLVYLFSISKAPSLFWTMFFLISFIFAIFITAYWKKDRQFNLYLSISLLWLSFTLSGYTSLNLMISKMVDKILTFL